MNLSVHERVEICPSLCQDDTQICRVGQDYIVFCMPTCFVDVKNVLAVSSERLFVVSFWDDSRP